MLLLSLLLIGCPEPGPGNDDDAAAADDDSAVADDDDTSADDPDAWRSSLYPEDWTPDFTQSEGRFLHDFSYAGYHYGEEAPPAPPPGPLFDVLDYGADPSGFSDSGPAIQATIDAAESDGGGVVVLPAGEYRVEDRLTINADGVVLQGGGIGQTFLYFTRSAGMTDSAHITFAGSITQGPDLLLAQDGVTRSHEVLLDDALLLQPGDEVSVGWTISEAFVAEHQMTEHWYTFNDTWRPFFRRTVLSVDTSSSPHRVSLDVPLRYPAKVRDNASLRVESGYLSECGLEDLSVSTVGDWNAAWNLDRSHAVAFKGTKDCWMRRVASYESPGSSGAGYHLLSGGVKVQQSKRVTISDSLIEAPQNRGGGGNGYLFEISRSSEILTRDSIGRAGRHNFIQNWDFGTSGCVWLRTTSTEGRALFAQGDSVGLLGFSEFHHSLAMANLIDDSVTADGWQGVNRKDWSSGAGHSATQNVFWNLRGGGELKSFQAGWGYIIGTENLTVSTDLSLGGFFGSADSTAPEDWLEGEDLGAHLVPSSLYEDQLARRLGTR
jgi:hypothetical protein